MGSYHQSIIQDLTGNINFISSTSNINDKSLISIYWNDIINKPIFSSISISDTYNNLILNKPWISTNNNYYTSSFIGIGTNNPLFNIDIIGNINLNGILLKNGIPYQNSQWISIFDNNSSNIYFNDGYINIGSSNITNNYFNINGNIKIQGNIIPDISSNFNLGSSDFKWRHLYLSSNSIYLDNISISKNSNYIYIPSLNINDIYINSNLNSNFNLKFNNYNSITINNKYPLFFDNPYTYSNIVFSNLFLSNSNIIYTNIKNLNTDSIPINTNKRFIINDIYDRDITFSQILTSSNIITSNINVIGDYTILNTTIYITEKAEINNNTSATAFIVKQINPTKNLFESYNYSSLSFIINSNGNIGIGNGADNNYKLNINGSLNINNDILIKNNNISNIIDLKLFNSSNSLINYNNLINKPNLNYISSNPYYSNLINKPFLISNNNYYSSFTSNFGLDIQNPSYKFHINGSLNVSDELFIKGTNISNIIDLKVSNSSNFIINYNNHINNPILSTVSLSGIYNDLIGKPILISDYKQMNNIPFSFNTTNSNLIYYSSNGNFGIGSTNPNKKVVINNNININGNLRISNVPISFSSYSNTNIISSNGTFSYISNNNSYGYYTYKNSGSISFPQNTNCDLLIVGAGGNGGFNGGGGGGGAGEVIYYPNYPFSNGTYNINVGYSDYNSNNRISKITLANSNLITALGGGNGAFNNQDIYNLFKNKPPWAMYFAENWSGTTLLDSSGNGRHATTSGTINKYTSSGNGASGNITYIAGNTSSTLSFPSGSIPSTFTILSLSKYLAGTRRRILQAQSGNWLHGHWNGNRGVCYYEGWKTPVSSVGNIDDWLCCIGKNSGTTPNNILIDGTGIGNATGGTGNYQLGINIGTNAAESSEWALSCVIIWNSALADSEMITLNNMINQYKLDGLYMYNKITLISSNAILGGSGGGSYYNFNNQAATGTKWNSNYSYLTSGSNGTTLIGGNGGSATQYNNFYSTSGGTVSPLTNINNTSDYCISITNTTTLTLNSNITCDILIVGGGGSGGNTDAGGGGAGGLIFIPNYLLSNGIYNITIGSGGAGYSGTGNSVGLTSAGNNGNDTIISSNSINLLIAKGGGGGGVGYTGQYAGKAGGSGGGAGSAMNNTNNNRIGGSSTQSGISAVVTGNSLTYGYGNKGGDNNGNQGGAGGGGASETGKNNNDLTRIGQGGNGLAKITINGINYNFKEIFQLPINNSDYRYIGEYNPIDGNIYFAGGGGGGHYGTSATNILGGLGGGGIGDYIIANSRICGGPGKANSGGGGGGGGGSQGQGGAGGSGVVIIRFKNIIFTESITGNNLILGIGGTGATSNSIPVLKKTYGSGGDGNGGLGTQGIVIIKVPLNITKMKYNGNINYNNIINRPYINNVISNSNLININIYNQINFPLGDISFTNEWFISIANSPTNISNSLIFWHLNSNLNINSKWWFNGTTSATNNEISDIRIKRDITEIQNPIDKFMLLKPKEYFLCDDKDYFKKYGIIAQDVSNIIPELVYKDSDYIANIYSYCNYFILGNSYFLKINDNNNFNNIIIGDELKILLNNNNEFNYKEIIIEDIPYHNRYKKRYVIIKDIIDEKTIEITQSIELDDNEKYNLFIYGKKVNDFLKLDYSSLYTLNIKCNQELYKIYLNQQEKLNNLNKRIMNLEA